MQFAIRVVATFLEFTVLNLKSDMNRRIFIGRPRKRETEKKTTFRVYISPDELHAVRVAVAGVLGDRKGAERVCYRIGVSVADFKAVSHVVEAVLNRPDKKG